MSPALALVFAKLLQVGCPRLRAVLYCCPELDPAEGIETAKLVLKAWMTDPRVIDAIDGLNGGTYADLEPEVRYKLALTINLAGAAFFLHHTNFSEANHREDIDRMKLARDIIKTELGQAVDSTDPMQAFARFAMDLMKTQAKLESGQKRPPQFRDHEPQIVDLPEQKH